jgi:hypothetical protein
MKKENQVAETVVEGVAEDLNLAEGGCVLEGDARTVHARHHRRIRGFDGQETGPIPFQPLPNKGLPKPFLIVGCGRTKMTDEAFRESMMDALAQNSRIDEGKVGSLRRRFVLLPDSI